MRKKRSSTGASDHSISLIGACFERVRDSVDFNLEALLKNTLLLPTAPPEAIVSTRMKTRVRLENSVRHTDEHQVTPVHKWRVWSGAADADRRKRANRALSNKTKCTVSALPAPEIVRGYNNELTGGLGFGQRFYWRRPPFCVIPQSINFTAELKWRLSVLLAFTSTAPQRGGNKH